MSLPSRKGWVAAIGAGREQLPSILRVQKDGWKVVALDGNPEAPGFSTADETVVLDLNDPLACTQSLKKYGIHFVVPAPVGKILSTVGAVNDELGLPGISRRAAMLSSDKHLFDQAVRKFGGRRPRQILFTTCAELADAMVSIGFPCIVKPNDGSGSRGVLACFDETDIAAAEKLLTEHNVMLCEEFVEGPEVGVDAAVLGGRVSIVLVRGKAMTDFPYRQEVAYSAPSEFPAKELLEEIQVCVDAIGLNDCLLHADVIIGSDGPVVVEMSGRPAGLLISSQMIPWCANVDYLGLGIALLCDPDMAAKTLAQERKQRFGHLKFLQTLPGLVRSVPSASELMRHPGIRFAEIWAKPGDVLKPIKTAADVLERGVILGVATDPEGAQLTAAEALSRVGAIETIESRIK